MTARALLYVNARSRHSRASYSGAARTAAIVFYGAHLHGEALDPDEVRIIAGLAAGAAAAYDRIEAEALRKDNEAMKNEVDSLRTRLAEIQI